MKIVHSYIQNQEDHKVDYTTIHNTYVQYGNGGIWIEMSRETRGWCIEWRTWNDQLICLLQ